VAAANPFEHPDAQRRFRVMTNVAELQRALDFPWEKWAVFPAPGATAMGGARLQTARRVSPVRRARARPSSHCTGPLIWPRAHPDARVLLTTFSDTLANALQTKLKRLLGNEPRLAERIDVHSLNAIGLRLYRSHVGKATLATREDLRELVQVAASCRG